MDARDRRLKFLIAREVAHYVSHASTGRRTLDDEAFEGVRTKLFEMFGAPANDVPAVLYHRWRLMLGGEAIVNVDTCGI